MRNTRIKDGVAKLSDTTGVYFFLGKKKDILYIGKATNLKNRVRSYFTKDISEKRSPLIAKMVSESKNIKVQKTDSVLEALILEASLIKKHQPPYNTAEKDQKSWNYIVITKEEFPKVLIVRGREITSPSEVFGPFPHNSQLKEALKIIRKIFPYRDKCIPLEKKPLAQRSLGGVGCFNYQLGLCPGVCINVISKKEYAQNIKNIKLFLGGKKKSLVVKLKKDMREHAKKRDFEKAHKIKRQIFALEHINDIALLKRNFRIDPVVDFGITHNANAEHNAKIHYRVEAYDVAHISGTNMVGVVTVVEDGEPKKSDYRMFKIRNQKNVDDIKALAEILERRLKHTEWPFPDLIVVDGGVAQLHAGQQLLKSLNIKIPVISVVKDKNHKPQKILALSSKLKALSSQILLANSEAHRFAINFHRRSRNKAFIKLKK
ncbi:MAG: GIY-YIG nuclease family protein [Patescibacteria group bacterium]